METMTRHERAKLLKERIDQSGLSTSDFAVRVLKRDPRLIRRWLDKTQAIPLVVLDFLVQPEIAPWPTRGEIGADGL